MDRCEPSRRGGASHAYPPASGRAPVGRRSAAGHAEREHDHEHERGRGWEPGPGRDRPDDTGWTRHLEAPEQGGTAYWRCGGCDREILVTIGRDLLVHADDCPNADDTDHTDG